MPKVLNARNIGKSTFLKIKKGLVNGSVYVGRPTKYGNPSAIGNDGTRDEVIEKYRQHISSRPDLLADIKEDLKGKDLVCWCAPEACHADVLLEIANES